MESVDNLAVRGTITSRDRFENFLSLGNLYSYQRLHLGSNSLATMIQETQWAWKNQI